MAVIGNYFQSTPSGAIASYDWLDYATRAGYKRYYFAEVSKSGGNEYILSPSSVDSKTRYYTGSVDANAVTLEEDHSYDLVYASPVTLDGNALFGVTVQLADGSASGLPQIYVVVTYNKVDLASTVTSIGTTTSETIDGVAGGQSFRLLMKTDLTRTQFKIGEKLRINVKLYSQGTGTLNAGANPYYLYTDGLNVLTAANDAFGASPDTDIFADVPYVIDI